MDQQTITKAPVFSSSEASLCRGETGEKEKESARDTMGRRKREDRFFTGSLCAEERGGELKGMPGEGEKESGRGKTGKEKEKDRGLFVFPSSPVRSKFFLFFFFHWNRSRVFCRTGEKESRKYIDCSRNHHDPLSNHSPA